MTHHNALRGPWLTQGITERLTELHALTGADYLTMEAIAAKLSAEFDVKLTKNSIVGRSRRLRLELRESVPFMRRKVTTMPKRSYHRVDAPIAPLIEPRCEDVGLTIYQLREGDCKWPLDPVEAYPPFTYCGKAAEIGRAYCWHHHNRAHTNARTGRE